MPKDSLETVASKPSYVVVSEAMKTGIPPVGSSDGLVYAVKSKPNYAELDENVHVENEDLADLHQDELDPIEGQDLVAGLFPETLVDGATGYYHQQQDLLDVSVPKVNSNLFIFHKIIKYSRLKKWRFSHCLVLLLKLLWYPKNHCCKMMR